MKDYVLFEMPVSRERQFVAMAVVQHYLHTYEDRHKTAAMQVFDTELYYRVNMPPDDWAFFSQIGLKLKHKPRMFDIPDMIIDLSDERTKQFETPDSRRHLADIYGIMSGVPCRCLPIVTLVEPDKDQSRWVVLDDFRYKDLRPLASEKLPHLFDGAIAGVIGYQSWGTFLAAAMQLPVIEILPSNRSRYRLSKWDHPFYRMVEEAKGDVELQIEQALTNLWWESKKRRPVMKQEPLLVEK